MLQPLLRVLVVGVVEALITLGLAAVAAVEWEQLVKVFRKEAFPLQAIKAWRAPLAAQVGLELMPLQLLVVRAALACMVFAAAEAVRATKQTPSAAEGLLAEETVQMRQLLQRLQPQIPEAGEAVERRAPLQPTTPPALAALASSVSGGLNKGLSWNLH
jgi:hypothetical protein